MNLPASSLEATDDSESGAGPGEAQQVLRLERVVLEHFGPFAHIEVDLHPRLTVLVAENGGGKSTVASAIGGLLAYVGNLLASAEKMPSWTATCARLVRDANQQVLRSGSPVTTVSGFVMGAPVSWHMTEKHPSQHEDKGFEYQRLPSVIRGVRKAHADSAADNTHEPPFLPLLRSLAPQRNFETKVQRLATKGSNARLNAPMDTYLLDESLEVRFDAFVQWFEALSLELAQEQMTGRPSPHKPEVLLEAIRRPVELVLEHTGWTRLVWDYAERDLVAEHPELGTLPVAELSDGIRTTIAMVGDLAHRAVRLNRHLGVDAAKLTPGVVVIDEVDLHLHPRWQQTILGLLMEAFPLVQFIVTTHSPQVISTVPRECIRVLSIDTDGIGTAAIPDFSPLAQDAGMALARIFDTPTRPDLPVLAHLHAYEMYVRHGQEELPEAQAALKRLVEAGVEIPEADINLWRFLAKRPAAQ